MGKNQHSKDRLFITATEWATQYGGRKRKANGSEIRPLPFDHCALSLAPFANPVMLSNSTGVIFDFENIVPYLKEHECDPVTGDAMTTKDIIRLHFDKNAEGEWQCPITNKVFTSSSHIVAIKTTGNVYSYNAVEELNLRSKNFTDLIDGSKFTRSDIITIQDPQNPDVMARRDTNSFQHLSQVRAENVEAKKGESTVRHSLASAAVMQEIERRQQEQQQSETGRRTTEDILARRDMENADDVRSLLALRPTVEDVLPGHASTDGRAGMSLTSTSSGSATSNALRLATPDEIREAKWKMMKKVGKKAFVQLQTNMGNLNLEVHCDIAPRTSWNFLTLCKAHFYDNITFHRLIAGFVLQGGDPSGSGSGGESAFGNKAPFRDEFDNRLQHSARGVLSMANSGANSNTSQFFITFKETPHLNNKHSVFARVVGGLSVLDGIEAVKTDKRERPVQDIKILQTVVFSDPIDEAEQMLEDFIRQRIASRTAGRAVAALPSASSNGDDEPDASMPALKLVKRV